MSLIGPSRHVAPRSLTVAFGAKRTLVGRPPQRFYEFTPLVAVSGQSKTWLNAKGS